MMAIQNSVRAFCAVFALFSVVSPAVAAPVSFAFEAEVASVIDQDGSADLPFTVLIGDTLSVSFELDSFNNGSPYSQVGPLSFDVSGFEFSLTGFLVTVEDNHVPNAVPIRGSIADPLNTPIVDQGPGVSDRIFLSCDHPFGLTCGALDNHDEIMFGPQIAFIDDQTVIDSSALDSDPATWNTFDFRELSLFFQNQSTGGTTQIGAYIGSISRVPEPPSGILAAFCGLFALWWAMNRR